MQELLTAFTLGNAAILTNVCMLPLYPGLIAFLAGTAGNQRSRLATGSLGVLVLAGILSMMIVIGLVLHVTQLFFGAVFSLLLPVIYIAVIVLGGLLLAGRSPFATLQTAQAPMLRNPYLSAYVYGLLFGPMTLPCSGPIIVTAFATGAGDAGALVDGIAYFIAFGVGFGWPLVVLPLLALPFQRRFVSWLTKNHVVMNRVSGVLLVGVGLFGFISELFPLWFDGFEVTGPLVGGFWAGVVIVAALVIYLTRRQQTPPRREAVAG